MLKVNKILKLNFESRRVSVRFKQTVISVTCSEFPIICTHSCGITFKILILANTLKCSEGFPKELTSQLSIFFIDANLLRNPTVLLRWRCSLGTKWTLRSFGSD